MRNFEGDTAPLTLLSQALQYETAGSRHKKDADFAEAYPVIEQHLARKVPQKTVLAKFNAAYGHTIHPPRFRKMLEDERTRRGEKGENLTCTTCGRPLSHFDNAKPAADSADAGGEA